MPVFDELSQYDNAWQKAEVKDTTEYENLPDGKYQVKIDEVRIENAKKSSRLQVAWVFSVEAPGEFKGRKIFHYKGIENEEQVGWLKQEVYNCGLTVNKISELPLKLPSLLDRIVEVQLKTKNIKGKDYQNVYINKLLFSKDMREEEVPINDDDLPF